MNIQNQRISTIGLKEEASAYCQTFHLRGWLKLAAGAAVLVLSVVNAISNPTSAASAFQPHSVAVSQQQKADVLDDIIDIIDEIINGGDHGGTAGGTGGSNPRP